MDRARDRIVIAFFRLRQNTLRLGAGMKGKVNRGVARKSEAGLAMAEFCLIPHRLSKIPVYRGGGEFYLTGFIPL